MCGHEQRVAVHGPVRGHASTAGGFRDGVRGSYIVLLRPRTGTQVVQLASTRRRSHPLGDPSLNIFLTWATKVLRRGMVHPRDATLRVGAQPLST